MSVLISDETLRACQMEAAEFKQEIALLLFQAGRLTIGHASHLAEMPPNAFREVLITGWRRFSVQMYYFKEKPYFIRV
jgi:predicted HTH domain antitoxin